MTDSATTGYISSDETGGEIQDWVIGAIVGGAVGVLALLLCITCCILRYLDIRTTRPWPQLPYDIQAQPQETVHHPPHITVQAPVVNPIHPLQRRPPNTPGRKEEVIYEDLDRQRPRAPPMQETTRSREIPNQSDANAVYQQPPGINILSRNNQAAPGVNVTPNAAPRFNNSREADMYSNYHDPSNYYGDYSRPAHVEYHISGDYVINHQ